MKRHPALVELSREHHAALVLARRTRRAGVCEQDALMAEVVKRHAQALQPHFAIEEAHLFPALGQAGQGALVQRALDDHAALRACVRRIAAGETAALHDFGARLDAHVRFEERELFPVAEAVLSANALAAVAHRTPPAEPPQ